MVRKTYTAEQSINKLREVLMSQGATIMEASRKIGVTEQTYYRWRSEYGSITITLSTAYSSLKLTVMGQ